MLIFDYQDIEKLTANTILSSVDQDKIDVLDEILKKSPNNTQVLLKKGFVLFQAQADGKAIKTFLQAIKADPHCVDAYVWLAELLLFHWADAERAVLLLNKAVTLDNNRADIYYLLACAAKKRDDSTRYIADLKKSLKIEPSWVLPRMCLVQELITQGDLKAAAVEFKELEKHVNKKFPIPEDEMQNYYERLITGRVFTPYAQEWLEKLKKSIA